MLGQLYYEQKVWEFLDKSVTNKAYYEIENIIIGDRKSLGRRIKAIFLNGDILDSDYEHFHVFIPNINDGIEIAESEIEPE